MSELSENSQSKCIDDGKLSLCEGNMTTRLIERFSHLLQQGAHRVLLCAGWAALLLYSTFSFAAGPTISAIAVASVTSSSATITWTTSPAATGQIFYGVNGGTNLSTDLAHALVTSHSLTLKSLSQQTVYTYEVQSTDSGGSTTSSTSTFALCNPGNPNSGFTTVTAGENAGYVTGTVTGTWTDNSGVSTSSPTVCGTTFSTTPTASVGLPGNLVMLVPDNNYIIPSPSSWIFTQSNASGLGANEQVNGATIDFTSAFGLQASPSGSGAGVASFNTRTGAVTAQSGDYTCAQVTNCLGSSATVTLTSSQLNNLATTPVAFGPTPASGTYLFPTAVVFEYTAGSTPFSVSGVTLVLGFTTFLTDGNQEWQSLSATGFLDQTTSQISGQAGGAGVAIVVSAANGAQLAMAASGGTISAGNGSLTVTVYYIVETI